MKALLQRIGLFIGSTLAITCAGTLAMYLVWSIYPFKLWVGVSSLIGLLASYCFKVPIHTIIIWSFLWPMILWLGIAIAINIRVISNSNK